MSLVVDASVAIKWFIDEPGHEDALELLESRHDLLAPDLLVAEVSNIAWKKARRGEITAAHAQATAEAVAHFVPNLIPSARLAAAAMSLSLKLNRPIYDCLYLACALQGNAELATADRKLAALASGSGIRIWPPIQ